MNNENQCPSIYQDIFSNPLLVEQLILIIYSFIFLVGLVGNMMTIIIIKYNKHLRTPTNFYLLNLAVSDLMMLMCNLPLEMLEISNREWPLPIIFCKLRNICAEFFTCSSILTILAFTCERYFTIVQPIHLHRLNHFRRAQNIILIIWFISLGFSLPLGLSYEIEINKFLQSNGCKSCVPKKNLAKILSIIIIVSSFCLFYFPMFIIAAIYLFIGKALRRVGKYEGYSNNIKLSTSSQSSLSNKEAIETQQHADHIKSYSWMKMRARYQARQVMVKTLVAVVIAFFVCYAPLYLQRFVLAFITINSNFYSDSSFLAKFLAYLYVISGITFYLGSVINPILYNVVSNKYRRAFWDLFCCRLRTSKRKLNKNKNKNLFQTNRGVQQAKLPEKIQLQSKKFAGNTNQQLGLNIIKTNIYSPKSNFSSMGKNKRLISYK